MTNPRKVQGEIDKLLKKITENIEIYDETEEKLQSSKDEHRTKFQDDLKKEIKKLQRLREQVKGYCMNSEVKNKTSLEKARRDIEVKMEGFKIIERDAKTKTYSKVGLEQASVQDRNDPKYITSKWLRASIRDLREKHEQLDFDLEAEGAGKKSKRRTDIEERLTRVKLHTKRLEQLLRGTLRGDFEPDDVDEIQAEVEDFAENANDLHHHEDNEDLYEPFDLPDNDDYEGEDDEEDDFGDSDDDNSSSPSQNVSASPSKPQASAGVVVVPAKKPEPAKPAATAATAAETKKETPSTASSTVSSPQSGGAKAPAAKPAGKATAAEVVASPTATQQSGKKQPGSMSSSSSSASQPGSQSATPVQLGNKTPTPTSPNKNSGANVISPAKESNSFSATSGGGNRSGGSSLMNTPAHSLGAGDLLSGGGAGGDAAGLLDGEDDEFNDDTFGDDAMEVAKGGVGNLSDLAGMTGTLHSDPNAKSGSGLSSPSPAGSGGSLSTTPSKPTAPGVNLPPGSAWAKKQPPPPQPALPGESINPSPPATAGGASGAGAGGAAGGAKVKSAWAQPLSSLVTTAVPSSQQPALPPSSQQQLLQQQQQQRGGNQASSPINDPALMSVGNVMRAAAESAGAGGGGGLDSKPSSATPSTPSKSQNTTQPVTPQEKQQDANNSSTSSATSASTATTSTSGAAAALSSGGASLSQQLQQQQQTPLTMEQTMRMLDSSLRNLPQPSDVERLKPYVPANPQQTPSYYPQKMPPCFSNPDLFQKFEPDTLFFIFYYQQGTYQHYLAAKELKRNSYRFHKKFTTWFQRHDRPKSLNEEQEQGTYVYFDFESGWCQRIKNDFAFRYTYLENELV